MILSAPDPLGASHLIQMPDVFLSQFRQSPQRKQSYNVITRNWPSVRTA